MRLMAAVHLSPWLTVPVALVVVVWALAYWTMLGDAEVPASRRWIRRFSLVIMLIGLPALVRASSFVDPHVDRMAYAQTWTVAIGALFLLIAVAVLDAINSVRLFAAERAELFAESMRRRRRDPSSDDPVDSA